MMRRIAAMSGAVVVLVSVFAPSAFAVEVTAKDLIDNGEQYDGMTVSVVGELIGDYGNRRDGYTWTQLNQDAYAVDPIAEGGPVVGANIGIGVRIPTDQLAGVDPPGRSYQRGPIVDATGTWRYHDPQRQGESFLDVGSLEVVRPGRALSEQTDWWSIAVGTILLLAGGALLLVRRRMSLRH
jgi:LPXTG-motif cell wall-anchored protein